MKTLFLTSLPALTLLSAIVLFSSCNKSDDPSEEPDQPTPTQQIVFEEKTYSFANADRPYRRAEINLKEGVTPSVIIYLHGGSARGNDNAKQMEEPAIQVISSFARDRGISAVFLVPQCPEKDSQGKMMDWIKMERALEYLISTERKTAAAKVFLFGGSMGGTGTWNMLSAYPDLFTSAMPCAGNPKDCIAANVAKTRVYAVMGSQDKVMKPEKVNLQSFLDEVEAAGGEYQYDLVEGWDHETTCKESYTATRLSWVFGL